MAELLYTFSYLVFLPLISLYVLLLPFINRFDKLKVLVVITAYIFALSWNQLISNLTSKYDSKKLLIHHINSIPFKKTIYVLCKIILISLWTVLCTRWTTYALHLKRPNLFIFYFTRYVGLFLLISLTIFGWTSPNKEINRLTSYLPIIACIWYCTGQYITRRFISVFISIFISTIYFQYVENIFVKNQVWFIKEQQCSPLFLFGYSIKLEDFSRHLVFSTLIVFTSAAFDKAKAVLDIFYPREYLDLRKSVGFIKCFTMNTKRMIKGLLTDEIEFPAYINGDLEFCMDCFINMKVSFSIKLSFSNYRNIIYTIFQCKLLENIFF